MLQYLFSSQILNFRPRSIASIWNGCIMEVKLYVMMHNQKGDAGFMRKRIVCLLMLYVVLFSACKGRNENVEVQYKEETSKEENGAITVYCMDNIPLYTKAIREYKQLYNIDVNIEFFENVSEMESLITVETLSGGGPDVFLFSSDTTLDVCKMMKNGAFYSLDEFMEKEQEEKYYSCMLDAGKYKDTQYILPFSFNMMQFYADSSMIEEKYPDILDGYTMSELLRVIENECSIRSDEDGATGMVWDIKRKDILNILLVYSQIFNINYEENQFIADKEAMKEMADFCLTFWNTEHIDEVIQQYSSSIDYFSHISFYAEDTSMLNAVRHNVSAYGMIQVEPYVYILPQWDEEEKYAVSICEYGAVNVNTSNPRASYQLLQTIMDYQISYDFNKYLEQSIYYLPVNKDNLVSCMEMVKQQRGKGKFTIYPLQGEYEKYAIYLENILNNIDAAYIPNKKVENIIDEIMKEYYMGHEDFKYCYDKLVNRLNLYLYE